MSIASAPKQKWFSELAFRVWAWVAVISSSSHTASAVVMLWSLGWGDTRCRAVLEAGHGVLCLHPLTWAVAMHRLLYCLLWLVEMCKVKNVCSASLLGYKAQISICLEQQQGQSCPCGHKPKQRVSVTTAFFPISLPISVSIAKSPWQKTDFLLSESLFQSYLAMTVESLQFSEGRSLYHQSRVGF